MALSQLRHGALIVFERETGLKSYIETGVRLDAVVTSDLLLTIFYPNTVLHDGGVIIRGARVVAAAAVLPLGGDSDTHRALGTRHRAALGISEVSDAIAVVVSEETGVISVTHNGQLIRGVDRKRLEQILQVFHKAQLAGETTGGLGAGHAMLKRLGLSKSAKTAVQAQSQSKR
jgi:diadenylate cyclase